MAIKKSAAGKNLSKIMIQSYMDLHQKASAGAFNVWIAINAPGEIFSGFENVVCSVPESHAAMCAGKGLSAKMCEKSENIGYSMDICSYARIDIGNATDGGADSPSFGLPKPDLMVSCNNNCALISKWFDVHHRQWGVPHFILDIPYCYEPQKKQDHDYIVTQYHDLIRLVEKLSGQTFVLNKFTEATQNTFEAMCDWKRFLSTARHKPSPISAFDSFVHMAPFLTLRGTKELKAHCKMLADEAESRIETRDFPVPHEKYRLFWDNIAPWHQLRSMSDRLSKMGANIVAAAYTSCIGTEPGSFMTTTWDGEDPFDLHAKTVNGYSCANCIDLRHKAMVDEIKKLSIDGVVFASNRSCKPFSIGQMVQKGFVDEQFGVPGTLIDIDHADVRKYNEENSFLRIQAMLEQIQSKKG
jgi:benzoyl-CoA reductase/2-hydroxyglutaryl-CoA dehydratase subunit BcrC/BadD/HgdB